MGNIFTGELEFSGVVISKPRNRVSAIDVAWVGRVNGGLASPAVAIEGRIKSCIFVPRLWIGVSIKATITWLPAFPNSGFKENGRLVELIKTPSGRGGGSIIMLFSTDSTLA